MKKSPFPAEDTLDSIMDPGGFSPPRSLAVIEDHPSAEQRKLREARRASMQNIKQQLDGLKDDSLTPTARIEQLLRLQASIMLPLMEEVMAERPDVDRSVVCARALAAVRDTVGMISKKVDLDNQDDFNPNSPKFQVAFGWFIDLVHRVLSANIADETLIHNIFHDLQNELAGFEDALVKRLRGVTARSFAAFESPFMADWRERLRETTQEHQRIIQAGYVDVIPEPSTTE